MWFIIGAMVGVIFGAACVFVGVFMGAGVSERATDRAMRARDGDPL